MSADAWGVCPRCKYLAELTQRGLASQAAAAYGKVPAEEYEELLAHSRTPLQLEETFREDYSIGMNKDGSFSIDYGGGCEVCGARFTYKYEKKDAITGLPEIGSS